MKIRVKNTTVRWLLDLFFPCYCKGCGKIGASFCSCCIFDMQRENPPFCSILDERFEKIMACGLRKGVLLEMILEYKFLSRRSYSEAFVEILGRTLKKFGDGNYIVVPLPTIGKHIRERGFDHIKLICEELSTNTGLFLGQVLVRKNKTVQVGADAETRRRQASEAYGVDRAKLDKVIDEFIRDGDRTRGEGCSEKAGGVREVKFLLVDDVWTTGSSMRAARDVLYHELMRLGFRDAEIKISAICLAKSGGYEF